MKKSEIHSDALTGRLKEYVESMVRTRFLSSPDLQGIWPESLAYRNTWKSCTESTAAGTFGITAGLDAF